MAKHSKLFYRAIARIRAIGNKNGVVHMHRIKQKLNTGFVRSVEIYDELAEGGVLKNWNDFVKSARDGVSKGNIIWEGLSKYRVPKKITEKETARVRDERKRGLL